MKRGTAVYNQKIPLVLKGIFFRKGLIIGSQLANGEF